MAWGGLDPWPWIEPVPSALGVGSLKQWTAREVRIKMIQRWLGLLHFEKQ